MSVNGVRYQVGTCPACRVTLWAEVSLSASLGVPTINSEGKADVGASAQFEGVTLAHRCVRDERGEWSWPERETEDVAS